jgi:hypothetical protein
MAKSNGIKDLKQAAKLLNKHAPDGESLAYINPGEARLLKAHGGSGIETLSGVPSYNWFTDAVNWVVDKGSDVVDWLGYSKDGGGGGKELIKDVGKLGLSTLAFFEAKKDREGLTAHEQKIYNDLKAQGAAADLQFALNVGEGPKVENVPTTIEDVASYTDVTLPALKTTAVAEGGRIGYSSGTENGALKKTYNKVIQRKIKMLQGMKDSGIEISAEDDKWLQEHTGQAQGGRIGYNLGGIGAMDPRMGYQHGSPHGQVIPTFSEGVEQMYESGPLGVKDFETINWERESPYGEIENLLKGTRVQESETIDYNTVPYPVIREKMKSYAGMIGSDNIYDIIKIATQVGDKEFVDYLRQTFTLEGDRGVENPGFSTASGALGAAYGGRIGAKEGGIMPLLNLGGMEKDYRQDGGFVPIGRREKADDVPARLSKNEFVFTADAVRNAGGGDIDKGAQRMYNVMKNLEAGGEISEQSQGQV